MKTPEIPKMLIFMSSIYTLCPLRRDVEPGPGARICSCHFRNGDKKNGPEILDHRKNAFSNFQSPEKRKRTKIACHSDDNGPSTSTSTCSTITQTPSSEIVELNILDLKNQLLQSSQTNKCLEAEILLLRKENEQLKLKMSSISECLSYELISSNDELIKLYTGLPNSKIFDLLMVICENIEINYYLKWKVENISMHDQLLITLMKLRLNLPHVDLGQRFKCSQATITNIFMTWIHILYENIFLVFMSKIPSKNKNKLCLPNSFSTFTNCRIILDCTEIKTDTTRVSMVTQKATFSSYKHYHTLKTLIGVAPNGVVTFVSDFFPGSTSDKTITLKSGVLSQLEPGDLILADKGFLIRDILPPNVYLNIPPFLDTPQFTPEQVLLTETIAKARIHVERAIQRIKCYRILDHIPTSLLSQADYVFKVVASLTNFQYPLIKEIQNKM
ncbi:uncharacterized protein LOC103310650 [Acyrthosiphon pisum]|uniref:THAP-type domain-containing protein n=1 Tax=Acyrthosiphon pisum TaxID=7029 RepID=A0A8R2NWW3_ACYPI|nr:uncharacterized protein LOC103310650 [Acyrthosiphon pisum]